MYLSPNPRPVKHWHSMKYFTPQPWFAFQGPRRNTAFKTWGCRFERPCAHGSTECLRTPASKVSLWCGSQHRPEHFNEGTYTVVADCDSDLRDRFALCQHLKGSKQTRLLSPTAKRHACLSRKRTHESTAGHSGKMRPVVQRAVISNIIQQSVRNSGQSFFSGYGQPQGLPVKLSNLITKLGD